MPESINPLLIFFHINWKTVGMEHLESKQENILLFILRIFGLATVSFHVAVHLGHAPDYTK